MKNKAINIAIFLLGMLLGADLLWAATRIRSATIIFSTLDSSPVGSTSPSSGIFTSLADQALSAGQCVQAGAVGVLQNIACPNFGSTTSVCSTSSASYNSCSTTTVPLNFTEPDTAYKATCSGINPSGFPTLNILSKSTTLITVIITNGTSNGAQVSTYSEVDCVVGGS